MASHKSPSGPAPRVEAASALPHDKVAERAYQIWLASGRTPGHSEQDWYQAERELRGGAPARSQRK